MSSADIPDIQDIVQMYLAQRNYSNDGGDEEVAGDDLVTEPAESRSLAELAVDVTASGAVTSTGSVHLAAVSLDPNTADAQYSRFRVWVLDAPEPYRSQLTELLFHVFVQLHLELVAGGHSPARFYSRHHVAFMLDALQCRTVTELAAVNSIDDLQRSHFKSYMTRRSHAALSADCVRYLRGALVSAAASVPLVVQVVALSISLQSADQRAPESEQLDSNQLPQPDSTSGLHWQCVKESADASPSSLSRDCGLQQAISALRRESPPAPTVCAYRVTGAVLSAAAVSRDLAALATAGDGGVRLWSLAPAGLQWRDNAAARVPLGCDLREADDGEQLPEDDDGHQLREGRCASRRLLGHCGSVFDVRFCQTDDALLLTAGEDGTVRGWRRDGCNNVCIYRGHNYPVWSVSCQRDEGQLFVTGSMDRTARLWTYERTHQLRVFVGHSQDVDCVAIHPNGNYVCTASGDGTLRLWSTAAAAEVRCISAHAGVVHDLQFSPDGKSVAVAGEDCTVRVYDLSGGALLHQLKSHRCSVSNLLWTPTGGCLVSADRDGTLLTWDTAANSSCATYSPSSTFVSPGYSVAGLHYARHNYLVAIYGQQG